jgi:predicted AlkP superfamily pyrophosphatase or phosphodiesterase
VPVTKILAVAAPLVALLAGPTSKPAAPAPRPRLVVVLSIDGLSFQRLESYRAWYTSGLKRLLDEGRVETASRYRHLNTETGPGHSSLSTGAPPRVTGIVANRWFQRMPDGSLRVTNSVDQPAPEGVPGTPPMFYREVAKGGRLYVFAQEAELLRWEVSGEIGRASSRVGYGPQGETVVFDGEDAITLYNFSHGRPKETFFRPQTIPGPGNLRVPTLGDRLVAALPGARVVSLSGKDRSAIFLAGRNSRHAAFWFDQDTGRFTTSAAYSPVPDARAIVNEWNRVSAGPLLPARFGLAWTRMALPDPQPSPSPVPNLLMADFQIPSNGVGWDHTFGMHPRGYFTSLYYSPVVDDLVAELALAFLRDGAFALGRREQPDLLALSFSAQDLVSHSYGPESEENLDVLRRLDLGRLLAALDATFPRGTVLVALSADHGMQTIPEAERSRDAAFKGGRLTNTTRALPSFDETVNRLVSEDLCLPEGSKPIFGAEGWSLLYNRPSLPLRTVEGPCGPADRLVTAETLDAVLPRLLTHLFREEIAEVLPVSQRERWPKDDPAVEFAQNDFDPERSGDVFLIPQPNALMHWDPARGTHHGSHHDYDTHVPLVFWGAGVKPARVDSASTPYDLAPTLAAALGITLPDAVGANRLPR